MLPSLIADGFDSSGFLHVLQPEKYFSEKLRVYSPGDLMMLSNGRAK
jgi:hypothetical protein